MFDDTYHTITKESKGIYKEKGSKFIAISYPVESEDEVKQRLEEIKKQYHDARHHCYAYQLGFDKSAYRVNDDGEPSGTAGKPIFGQIQSKDLTNVLVVVVRYFGGTKLGVSGLIRAYKSATKDALDNSTIITKTVNEVYELKFEYPLMNEVMRVLKEDNIEQLSHNFELSCSIIYSIRKRDADRIREKFALMQGVEIKFIKIL